MKQAFDINGIVETYIMNTLRGIVSAQMVQDIASNSKSEILTKL